MFPHVYDDEGIESYWYIATVVGDHEVDVLLQEHMVTEDCPATTCRESTRHEITLPVVEGAEVTLQFKVGEGIHYHFTVGIEAIGKIEFMEPYCIEVVGLVELERTIITVSGIDVSSVRCVELR